MENLRLLFINPCLRRNAKYKILPMGLACVMTFIHEQGYEFDLLDVDINEYDDEYVEQYLRTHQYDVILYGSIVTHYKWIKWITKTIKRYHPQTKVVVGNSVAGSCYEVFLKNAPADVVVIGEGEYSCLEVLNSYRDGEDLAGIPGIAYRRDDGKIIRNQHRKVGRIDELPMVNWDFFDIAKYFEKSQDNLSFGEKKKDGRTVTMPVSTARGCINKCTFCHYVFWDDPYRFRSPSNIVAEIKRNIDKYGATYINFWDDLSFAALPQVEDMVGTILDSGLKFGWSAAIRTDLLGNPEKPFQNRLEVAMKMKAAGCSAVGFSLESGNKDILTMMKKHVKVEYFSEQIRILKQVGITSNVSVIIGYPIETKATIHETFDMCLANGIYPSLGYLLPLPYTGMYKYALEHGYITDEDAYLTSITERQDICLNMTQMTNEEVTSEIKECARKGNELLGLGLDEKNYIKAGGYKRHTNIDKQMHTRPVGIDPDTPKRNENDFSFNYSAAVFHMERGEESI